MSSTHYERELSKLRITYAAALEADVSKLKDFIASSSESSVVGVGSGGSYTVASLLCNLHESYTGRLSRPATPLELICNPTLAASSPVFLISAEGKNPDIVEALKRARQHSSRNIHVLTNRESSPLLECASEFTDIAPHVFALADKDGYLATNSLLLDAMLIARAYSELDQCTSNIPESIDGLRLAQGSLDEWLEQSASFTQDAAARGNIIVVYSPHLRPIAADLESKLSEAALLHCQPADLRSFAHGRHLWLSERPKDCTILALTEPGLQTLWEGMRASLPKDVPTLTMSLNGVKPADLLAGLVAQMRFVSALASKLGKDPGRPEVPRFGRDVYYADLTSLIPKPEPLQNTAERSKFEALGARWPSIARAGTMKRALEKFQGALESQHFRAIVFDYDGTLCSSQSKDSPPSALIIERIAKLLNSGILIGIASGRGGSIHQDLRRCISEEFWPRVHLGLYNGGWIGDLSATLPEHHATSEFLSHVTRIVERLKALGVPIRTIRATHPHQISVRFFDGVHAESMWFVIGDALRQAGLDLSSVVRSKHSVDILAPGVDKSHLIAQIIQQYRIDPYEILTMGDQGAWPGNDSSLLEHRFSLSVDVPSRRLDRAWKLAPSHKRDVDATLWYLDRFIASTDTRTFRVALQDHLSKEN
jgi:HAD superfamily hydrolase (TIGR01484 family)